MADQKLTSGRVSSEILGEKILALEHHVVGLKVGIEELEKYVTSGGPDIPGSGNAQAFFANLSKMKARLGEEGFITKLISEMAKWPGVAKDLISLMAWNDHNSGWHLNREEIAESMTLDGEPITAEMIAESLSSMVETT